jgi:membrane-associated phospholipid phosphatase
VAEVSSSYAVGDRPRRGTESARRVVSVWQHRRDRRVRGVVATALLLLVSSAAFGHIVEDYLTGDPIVRWDVEFARWLHEHSSPRLVNVFEVVTLAGNVAVLAAITLAAMVFLLRRRALDEAVLVGVVALGIETVNAALKLVFHRPRPELSFVHLDTYSFPSGHAAGSAAVYGVLAYVVARRVFGLRRIAVVAGAVVLVGAVGMSRLYLGAHYLSDVLAGLALGATWLSAWLLVAQLYADRDPSSLLPPRLRRAAARLAAR